MNPADVRADFVSSLADLEKFYASAKSALTGEKEKTLLVENTFLAAAVQWEGFLSDLIVSYVNRDATRFSIHLRSALETEMSLKQKRIYSKYAILTIPVHLKKADVVELLDAQGNNITFRDFTELKKDALRWLVTADANRIVALPKPQQSVFNVLVAMRNHIAHRSKRSQDAMNDALSKGALRGTGLQRGVNLVRHPGAYLKAQPKGHMATRIEIFLSQMRIIAAAF